MEEKTLENLKNNPHYKMNAKQKAEYESIVKKPMIQFGKPDVHDNQFAKHDTFMVKTKYENKKGNK